MSDDLFATRRFKALTDEWTSEELGRFFWLTLDDMHRISASLKDGTVTAVLLTAKLQALDNKNLIVVWRNTGACSRPSIS